MEEYTAKTDSGTTATTAELIILQWSPTCSLDVVVHVYNRRQYYPGKSGVGGQGAECTPYSTPSSHLQGLIQGGRGVEGVTTLTMKT